MLLVERVSIWIAKRNQLLTIPVWTQPVDEVLLLIRDQKRAARLIDRPLGKAEAIAHHLQLCIFVEKLPKSRVQSLQLKRQLRTASRPLPRVRRLLRRSVRIRRGLRLLCYERCSKGKHKRNALHCCLRPRTGFAG